jgi:ribosomal RNA assembly protein
MRYVRIPKERVGVLIGREGETKRTIEERAHVHLEIDSEEGEVAINDTQVQDPLLSLKVEDIVRAIGRGFSPEAAFRLFKDDVELYIFDIYDYAGKTESHLERVKARVIGRDGKTKRVIESITGSNVAIYGHTVGLISDFEGMDIAKRALDMLLSGSQQPTVYRFLEREMKKVHMGIA